MAAVLTEATSEASLQQRRENGAPLLKQLRECVGEARRRQEERNVLIVAAVERGVPVVDIARCAGLSRRGVYHIIEAEGS